MSANSFEVVSGNGLPGTALSGACAAKGKGRKYYLSENRQTSSGSGKAQNRAHGNLTEDTQNQPCPFPFSHFIDEKTETQRKGLRDLPMTLEPAEAEAGLECRFPGPLRSVLFEKSPEDLGRNGPLLLRSKVEVRESSPAFQ